MSRLPGWAAFSQAQVRSPLLPLVVAAAMCALSTPLIAALGIDPSWTALLPDDRPSVRDLEQVQARVGGLSTLTVAVESADASALMRFADDLGPRLEQLPSEWVRGVDWRAGVIEQFAWENRHLYAELSDLEEIRDVLSERRDYERRERNPLLLNLDDTPPPDPTGLIDRLSEEARDRRPDLEGTGGYLMHDDGRLLVLLISTPLSGTELDEVERFTAQVEAVAASLEPTSYATDLRVRLAGGLLGAQAEQWALVRELATATLITVGLVLVAILLFFGHVRAIFLLGLAMLAPLAVTFAIARLTVGSLNTSTAFLGSIVIGNGVNPNIIWLARYFELRRAGLPVAEALEGAHRGTWLATMTASLAAAAAYASLVGTDFRGFRDFGIISGVGMVACWVGAYSVLPALCVVGERIRPLRFRATAQARLSFGGAAATLVNRHTRAVLWSAGALGLISLGIVAAGVLSNPFEYDFRRLRSERRTAAEVELLTRRIDEAVGRGRGGDAIAVLVPRIEDAELVTRQLDVMRNVSDPPLGSVASLQRALPADQEAKVGVLAEIRALAQEVRPHASVSEREIIDRDIPPADLSPLQVEDLPDEAVRPFRERDGTAGRLILVGPAEGRSVWDGRYLMDWAAALRSLRLEDGSRPPLAGRAPVFADLIEAVWSDGPRAIMLALGATIILIILAFPYLWQRVLTLVSLLLGILWMAATMLAFGMKLNFLNFVAFPITCGNGVDYGVNVMRRMSDETSAASEDRHAVVDRALRQTGAAVALCSLTTVIGYVSLQASSNLAIRSFGQAMAISEVTCLAAATLVLTAMFLRRGRP